MVPGDHRESAGTGDGSGAEAGDSHWVRWHAAYEDSSSMLSQRLGAVQSMVRAALDEMPVRAEPIRMVSLCAGQGRDVSEVVATHPKGASVSALLVELDPALAAFARERVAELGVADQVRIVEGDASQASLYADAVPADVVLVCGIFGNISAADITRTIAALPGFCAPGGHVVWTRHRLPPDHTPAIRADFAAAGFTELGFETPDGVIQGVGHHRLDGPTVPFDPGQRLFEFVGDGNPV
jgi:ubiquinone/menaquinone biosynthesis C-methylase UbiE